MDRLTAYVLILDLDELTQEENEFLHDLKEKAKRQRMKRERTKQKGASHADHD